MAWPATSARSKNWGTEILTDTDLENELDLLHTWLNDAMNSSTGHKHDGTTSEGPKILVSNLNLASGAEGDVVYRNGSNLTRLAIGTADQVLKVNSGATAPEWGAGTTFASAAEVKTGTESAKAVAPDTLYNHEGMVKAWASVNGTGTPAYNDSYNFTGTPTDNGTGDYTLTIDTDFGSTNYAFAGIALSTGAGNQPNVVVSSGSIAVGSIDIEVRNSDDGAATDTTFGLMLIGDR